MTRKQELWWWIYVVSGLLTNLLLAPWLISARDTLLNILGIVFVVAYAVWTWKKFLGKLFKEAINELRS